MLFRFHESVECGSWNQPAVPDRYCPQCASRYEIVDGGLAESEPETGLFDAVGSIALALPLLILVLLSHNSPLLAVGCIFAFLVALQADIVSCE